MAILVIAEHDNKHLKPSVANTVAAATKLGGEISVLVAGSECGEAAAAAAQITGVTKVLVADAPHYAVPLAENMAALVVSIADKFTHILAPADRKSTRLNSSHQIISYAVFCLKKKRT